MNLEWVEKYCVNKFRRSHFEYDMVEKSLIFVYRRGFKDGKSAEQNVGICPRCKEPYNGDCGECSVGLCQG